MPCSVLQAAEYFHSCQGVFTGCQLHGLACQQLNWCCREQTAGHNALLLFVHLALTMMEGRLNNAFKDLKAKKAEVKVHTALIDWLIYCMQP